MDSSEWELSKENVQPIKQGRKIPNLLAALCMSQIQACPSPPGAFACLVRPRGGAFACEHLPGGGAFEIMILLF